VLLSHSKLKLASLINLLKENLASSLKITFWNDTLSKKNADLKFTLFLKIVFLNSTIVENINFLKLISSSIFKS
jgi:hypothetical protein